VAERRAAAWLPPPATTALGALLGHITGGHLATEADGARSFQPMNINFGLFPPLAVAEVGSGGKGKERGAAKKRLISARALADLERWLTAAADTAAA
jgi:methylenetetrahydrofolate--tRNA-(uracil-5-)-methyltransferase